MDYNNNNDSIIWVVTTYSTEVQGLVKMSLLIYLFDQPLDSSVVLANYFVLFFIISE